MAADDRNAPGPLRWIWYAMGGRLPDQYRDWVRHDLTTRTWLLRYTLRIIVRALPLLIVGVVVLAVLPVPGWTVPVVPALGLVLVLYMTLTSAQEFRRATLVQHGMSSRDIPDQ